jgi:uroporphyrinogen-III synthase
MIRSILVTRPVDDTAEIAGVIESLGFQPVFSPSLKIIDESVALPDPASYRGLIFSSVNGVRAFARLNPDASYFQLPAFAVGPGTAAELAEIGFTEIHTAAGTMRSLIPLLQAHFKGGAPLLHFRGRDIRDDPSALLPWPIDGITLYRAEQIESLDSAALDALSAGSVAAVLLYSARSAEAFVLAAKNAGMDGVFGGVKALCLADSVLESAHHLNWAECHVAATPDQNGMIRLLEELKRHDHQYQSTT